MDQVLKGFNGTIMAYGQTASGKTFTMQGNDRYDRIEREMLKYEKKIKLLASQGNSKRKKKLEKAAKKLKIEKLNEMSKEDIVLDPQSQGIIPRVISTIFQKTSNSDLSFIEYSIIVSISEIYNEKVNDLLDPDKQDLRIVQSKNKGVMIQGITEFLCNSEEEVYRLIDIGNKNRAVGSNRMNDRSSRSHTILTI